MVTPGLDNGDSGSWLQQQLAVAEAQSAQLEKEIKQARLRADAAERRELVAEASGEYHKTLSSKLNERVQATEAQRQEAEEQRQQAEAKRQEAEAQRQQAEAQREAAEAQCKEADTRAQRAEASAREAEARAGAAAAAAASEQESVLEQLRGQVKSLEQQVLEAGARQAQAEELGCKLRFELEQAGGRERVLVEKCEQLTKAAEEAAAAETASSEKTRGLDDAMQHLADQIAALTADNERLSKELAQSSEEVDRLEAELGRTAAERDSVDHKLQLGEAELTDSRVQLREAQEQLVSLESKLAKAQADSAGLQEDLRLTREELDAQRDLASRASEEVWDMAQRVSELEKQAEVRDSARQTKAPENDSEVARHLEQRLQRALEAEVAARAQEQEAAEAEARQVQIQMQTEETSRALFGRLASEHRVKLDESHAATDSLKKELAAQSVVIAQLREANAEKDQIAASPRREELSKMRVLQEELQASRRNVAQLEVHATHEVAEMRATQSKAEVWEQQAAAARRQAAVTNNADAEIERLRGQVTRLEQKEQSQTTTVATLTARHKELVELLATQRAELAELRSRVANGGPIVRRSLGYGGSSSPGLGPRAPGGVLSSSPRDLQPQIQWQTSVLSSPPHQMPGSILYSPPIPGQCQTARVASSSILISPPVASASPTMRGREQRPNTDRGSIMMMPSDSSPVNRRRGASPVEFR
mmetsp:Transcript_8206/g.19645  ORF Transcript_8206/g.19645 Transcript_8206/m.19645 type:complete len:708 (-) Transcript_8206:134-2257(-)